ncbi:prepilin peptidase, partial [Marinobacter sp. 1Y8]
MQFIQLLQENIALALFVFGLLGLCVGSFLNVVIHRIPLMMVYGWRQECS